MKKIIFEAPPLRWIRTIALVSIAGTAMLVMSQSANAQSCGYGGGYGGGYRGNGISIGISNGRGISFGYSSYRPRPVWHNTTHYDYHPSSYQRHRNHYDYRQGHYDLHRSGHWHR